MSLLWSARLKWVNVRNRTFRHVQCTSSKDSDQPARSRSEPSLGAFWIAKHAIFLHADNRDSDQTARRRRLNRIFVGRTCQRGHFLTLRLIFRRIFYSSSVYPICLSFVNIITRTYLHNFDPLKPHVYTVKLGFTGVYIIFLVSA